MWGWLRSWFSGDVGVISSGPAIRSTDPLMTAFNSAMGDVGQGEVPRGSNGGPYCESLRLATGLQRKAGGQWCAVFISAHLQRAGLPVGSRGAPGIVRAVEQLPGGRRVTADELVVGKVYVALRKRGLRSHHVQMFLVIGTLGGVMLRHVGGNEKHRVCTRLWQPERYLKGVKKIVTYNPPETL